MAKGLPKSLIKKYGISKKAWRVFRGRKKRPRSRASNPKRRKKSNPNRRTRKMGRKNKRRGGKSLQQTVFKYLRLGSLAAPGLIYATQPLKLDQKLNEIFRVYSGVNIKHSIESNEFQFDWKRLAMGWGPFLATTLVTYGIPKLAGIIRRI